MVDDQLLGRDQAIEVEPQGLDVGGEVRGAFLETHEHAGLAELGGAVHQEGHADQRLAAARRAAQERRPASRHTTQQDLIEAPDPRGGLFERRIFLLSGGRVVDQTNAPDPRDG